MRVNFFRNGIEPRPFEAKCPVEISGSSRCPFSAHRTQFPGILRRSVTKSPRRHPPSLSPKGAANFNRRVRGKWPHKYHGVVNRTDIAQHHWPAASGSDQAGIFGRLGSAIENAHHSYQNHVFIAYRGSANNHDQRRNIQRNAFADLTNWVAT